jgi:hypothetical protein
MLRIVVTAGHISRPASNSGTPWVWLRLPGLAVGFTLLLAAPARAATTPDTGSPIQFFTNVAHKLLVSSTTDWAKSNPAGFLAAFGTSQPFGVTNIPVWAGNRPGSNFVYSPAVHRLLQLTANIYDATTNRHGDDFSHLPTVFRPTFSRQDDNVFIAGFIEETNTTFLTNTLRVLADTNDANALQSNDLVFGVPPVLGVKKGLPNFNEIAMQSVFQITRKLQVTRTSTNRPSAVYATNVMYVLGLSNVVGVEAWNPYHADYTHPVDIYVTNFLNMTLSVTNDAGVQALPPIVSNMVIGAYLPVPNGTNTGWPGFITFFPKPSFQIPLLTNIIFLPDSIYRFDPPGFTTNLNGPVETGQGFPLPQWRLVVTNRLQFIMVDHASGHLIDYVQLDGLSGMRDLSGELVITGTGLDHTMWLTNRINGNSIYKATIGVFNQIDFSLGNQNSTTTDWTSYGQGQASGTTKLKEIDSFRVFMGLAPITYPGTVNTNLALQVPFTPTRRISQYLTWQANDPLVHYLTSDLDYLAAGNQIWPETLKVQIRTLKYIGLPNERYQPWGQAEAGTDPNSFNLAMKDPLVRSSDDWDFPDAQPLSLAMLGQVHRGTPWQTLCLKASNILTSGGLGTWINWTGNTNVFDAINSAPTNDWRLAALLAPLLNTNDPRQLLSVNTTDSNAWLSILGGIVALTNTLSDAALAGYPPAPPQFDAVVMQSDSPQATLIAAAIATTRQSQPGQRFRDLGGILATPELSVASPWLNLNSATQMQYGINDEAYETIPSQLLSRLRPDSVGGIISTNGQVVVQFTGYDGYAYAVGVSSNLTDWTLVSTNYPSNGVFNFPDTAGPRFRFYRSILLP